MTDDSHDWEIANEVYLAAALDWLRLKLMRQAPPPPLQVRGERRATSRPSDSPSSPPWWKLRRDPGAAPIASPPVRLALPPAPSEISEEQIKEAQAIRDKAAAGEHVPALIGLAARLSLSSFERDILLLCAAMELDTRIAPLCAQAHDDPLRSYPTFALAMAMFDEAAWEAMSPEGALRRWRLFEINQAGAQPLTVSALRADERIVNFVKGLNHLDDRVAPFVSVLDAGSETLPPSQQETVASIVETLHGDSQLLPVQLLGSDAESKQLVARGVASALGLRLCRVAPELLPAHASDIETLARLWLRETILHPLALYVDARSVDRNSDTHATALKRFLERTGGVLFVDVTEAWPVVRGSHVFDIAKPTPQEQRALWTSTLGDANAVTAARLAGQFDISAPTIQRIGAEVAARSAADAVARAAWQKCTAHTRPRIDALAQRVDARARWADIVLPENETALLEQIAAHVAGRMQVYDDWGFRARMNRGLGISALFAGESGTGKTMAAEVVANDLELSLHRIDLSAVVSKWVGETEANIQRLFQAAEDGGGILFFDEADALFGKRTEVQHSQDRFANIEINFLLQRMETYRGLVILATNMKSALDRAFLRRLNYVIDFPFPSQSERREIWRKVFPPKTPVEGLDLDRLARLNVTGGSAQNIALTAAFMAAKRGLPVTMAIVLEAARMEMRKLERPINEAEFRWRAPQPVAV